MGTRRGFILHKRVVRGGNSPLTTLVGIYGIGTGEPSDLTLYISTTVLPKQYHEIVSYTLKLTVADDPSREIPLPPLPVIVFL